MYNALPFVIFQQTLRRMCYLTIKEMATISEDVIIVTSRWVSVRAAHAHASGVLPFSLPHWEEINRNVKVLDD